MQYLPGTLLRRRVGLAHDRDDAPGIQHHPAEGRPKEGDHLEFGSREVGCIPTTSLPTSGTDWWRFIFL